ncbi:Metallo-dependent phosphatase-like protein [Clohesyomyces aquaticus]|uniref:Endopolyphosphatase n=1 Tax=Clohesyomyces aquaticus TaxID=1231657 RepID=A0A1Y1Y936_9PLEO|nr:Metallo-dependent phosphatase-like protein [Clohesyomyces aquaticus]
MLLARRELSLRLICVLLAAACSARAAPHSGAGPEASTGRRLQGRFLHITDIHPDPFYKTYSSTEQDAACHRKRGPAGVYGAETSACDAPFSLVNETFEWIRDNLKDKIDFVVWTGDSARHDNDEKIPRTQEQVIDQNEYVVDRFRDVFGTDENSNDTDPTNDFIIPIVPTLGNNDIMPHNIMLSGPNKWTMKYLDTWRNFIPEEQRHQFQRGGWFFTEVIPGKLAVISLNTLFFFDSNSGVDGCADKHEPGYEHMEWLRIQLQILRERGLKVILMGHVPPARTDSKLSWDETCWQKFTLNLQQYRDIIVGSIFGHMNIDHFMIQDFNDLAKDTKNGRMASAAKVKSEDFRVNMFVEGEVTTNSASDYLVDLRNSWAKLPSPPQSVSKSISKYEDVDEEEEGPTVWGSFVQMLMGSKEKGHKGGNGRKADKKKYLDEIGGKYGERYSVSYVSPSVVPNYFPTLRIIEYNMTGLEKLLIPAKSFCHPSSDLPVQVKLPHNAFSDDESWENYVYSVVEAKKKKKEKDARKKPKKYKFKVPTPPSKSTPPGPAYSPQTLSLLGYKQYFANLTRINNDFTATSQNLDSDMEMDADEIESSRWKEGKHKKHQGKKPRPKPHPKKFKFELEYDTTGDKLFKLKSLLTREYVNLARRIGNDQQGKVEDEDAEMEDEYSEESNDDTDEIEAEKKKKGGTKHKKKKHGKKHKNNPKHGAWFNFVKRAFVETMDPDDIEEMYDASQRNSLGLGDEVLHELEQEQEVLEL